MPCAYASRCAGRGYGDNCSDDPDAKRNCPEYAFYTRNTFPTQTWLNEDDGLVDDITVYLKDMLPRKKSIWDLIKS
jgi:hypothetical protein